jgi:ATP-dependent Clp protease ATP-binding subunit ClpB
MDFAKLTQMSRQAVTDAQNQARRLNHHEVDTWHLLAALLAQEGGVVPGLIDKLNLAPGAMQLAVERERERLPKVTGSVDTSKVYVTQAVNDVLTRGEDEAKSLKNDLLIGDWIFRGIGSGRGLRGGWLIETESDPWCPLTLTTV